MAWWITLAVVVALDVIAYLITPKPKQAKPTAAAQLEDPTAEAGIEIPIIVGTITMIAPNCLGFWDKSQNDYEVDA